MSAAGLHAVLPASAEIAGGRLRIAGCDLGAVAAGAGTPAYVYDEGELRRRARAFRSALEAWPPGAEVLFACKALAIRAAMNVFAEEGLGVEACSPGELRAVLSAGIDAGKVALTGSGKDVTLLGRAVEAGVGRIVLDGLEEIPVADQAARAAGRTADVLLSVVPRADVEGIRRDPATGQLDRKHGLRLIGGDAAAAVERVRATSGLRLAGLHMHLGARLYDAATEAIDQLAAFAAEQEMDGCELDLGGGPNVPVHREGEAQPSIAEHVATRLGRVERCFGRAGLALPRILMEPGRALVGTAGLLLTTVRAVRHGVRTYVHVDAGLSVDPRALLYGARLDALLPCRMDDPADEIVSIAGSSAEAGDVLVWDTPLPLPKPGDLVAIPAAGAYAPAMASNWNLQPRPPVVFCRDGQAREVVRRETEADVLAREIDAPQPWPAADPTVDVRTRRSLSGT